MKFIKVSNELEFKVLLECLYHCDFKWKFKTQDYNIYKRIFKSDVFHIVAEHFKKEIWCLGPDLNSKYGTSRTSEDSKILIRRYKF